MDSLAHFFQRCLIITLAYFAGTGLCYSHEFPTYQSQLRWGLHTRPKTIEPSKEPVILWVRMREAFQLEDAKHNPRVEKYIKQLIQSPTYYFNILSKNATPYLYLIVEEVAKRNIPMEIALLPMVESAFNPLATSSSGAKGLWQLMPATSRTYGIKEDQWYSGRQDVLASTEAALDHLLYLKKVFKGNWLHALAAYNSGEGRVAKAIKSNQRAKRKTDFWSLALPNETRDYVPKLLALVTVIQNPTRYGVVLPTIPNKPFVSKVQLPKPIRLPLVAELTGLSIKEIMRLNPGYLGDTTHPHGPHNLLVPIAAIPLFQQRFKAMDAVKFNPYQHYKIKAGDSLSLIAKNFDTTIEAIKKLNQLSSASIQVGKVLLVPLPPGTLNQPSVAQQSAPLLKTKIIHIVEKGDSLWSISKKYRVTLQHLTQWNALTHSSALLPGQQLIIYSA
jgi:membrane-bound lytic murein transglycosylase D